MREIDILPDLGENAVAPCRLTILGGFALETPEGHPLVLSTRKDRLLLAYLAVSGGKPQQRGKLAGLLWADRSEAQARESFRQSLASLRQAFRSAGMQDPLHADRDTAALDPSKLDIDVAEFEKLARMTNPAALELYRGELLEGSDPPTSEFDAWLRSERLRLEELAIGMLERLESSNLSSRTKDLVLQVGLRLLDRDPLRESVYRALMRVLQAQGKRAEALKLYKRCRDVLKTELGITPDLETEQLYRDVLTDRSSQPASLPSGDGSQSHDSRSSLAVMPFDNLSADSALNPLCEGLAEDVITGVGRFRLFSVIDRHSSSVIAKRTADTAEISKQLGVKFIVQGSLLRLPDSLRVTVRLVDASKRVQCWGETYSIPGSEVSTLSDKVVGAIVATLHSRLESSLIEQGRHKPSWDAYECVLQGIKHIRGYAPGDNLRAVELFQRAVELDPNYALARAYRAFADVVLHNYSAAPPAVLAKSKAMAQEAVELDPYNPSCQWLLGLVLSWCGDWAGEERAYRRALELNPGDANVMTTYGVLLAAKGRAEEGVALIREAMKLNPYHPEWYWGDLGSALYFARRYADAVEAFLHRSNTEWVLARLAACYAQLDLMDEAARAVSEVLKLNPNFSIAMHRLCSWTFVDLTHFAEGMRKAGLPD